MPYAGDVLVTAVRIEFLQHGPRVGRPSRRRVGVSQVGLDPRIVPLRWSRRDFELADGVVHPAHHGERHPELEMHPVVARADRQRAANSASARSYCPRRGRRCRRRSVRRPTGDPASLAFSRGDGLIEPPLPHQREAHRARQLLATVPHFGGPLQGLGAVLPAPVIQRENLPQHEVRLCQRVVELQGPPRCRLCLRNRLVWRKRTAKQKLHLGQRQCGIRFGEIRLDGDRLLEISDRTAERVMLLLAVGPESSQIGVIRLAAIVCGRRRPWEGGGTRPAATAISDAIFCWRSSIWLNSPS